MDEFYDMNKAGNLLEEHVQAIETQGLSSSVAIQLANADVDTYQVLPFGQPPCWRLAIPPSDGSTEADQAIFRVQGIITDKNLPPIGRQSVARTSHRTRPHLRQAVTITGLQTPVFTAAIEAIEKIQLAFVNAFPADMVDQWQPSFFKDVYALDTHSRYFTKTHLVPNQEKCPFDHATDPEGILASMQDETLIHIADNHVDYLGPISIAGEKRMGTIGPATFRVGDIVELSISFAAFPSANGKVKMMAVLRSIRMIDNSCRNTASILQMRSRYRPLKPSYNLTKRKAMYSDEEVKNIERGVSKLRMEP
ncbi:hypothetical protein BDN70DRAFT_902321 [Pholiota conissans]|uniref:Uncharacterized protein n=1 Tax=Pholiota conissans TaxID=109636 RepID=A0A9P6CKN4_9AGAR|nr:hypothetical protein BDN70DRAFT_902321 [Pholiota conissans]